MGTPTNRNPAKVRLDIATDPDYQPTISDMIAIGKDVEILKAVMAIDIPPFIKDITTIELGNVKRAYEHQTSSWKQALGNNNLGRDLTHERVAHVLTLRPKSSDSDRVDWEVYLSRTANHWLVVQTDGIQLYQFSWFRELEPLIKVLAKQGDGYYYIREALYLKDIGSLSPASAITIGLSHVLDHAISQRRKVILDMTDSLETIRRRGAVFFRD